jgi:hypothetical protein
MKQGQATITDAEILFPEKVLTIKGETITVKEITFTQGLKLGRIVQALISDLSSLFAERENADYEDLAEVFAEHEPVLMDILAITTGKEATYFNDISDSDGQSLMMTLWTVNGDFFTRRLVSKSLSKHIRARADQSTSASSIAH